MTTDGRPQRDGSSRFGHDDDEAPERLWQSREVRWSAVSGVLLAVGFLAELADAPSGVALALFVAATLAGMRFFAVEALEELVREQQIGIELLMAVAIVIAAALGLWEEAASLAFLYSISEALEEFTEERTRGAIRALMDLAPARVLRLDPAGTTTEVPLEELAVGERFLVRPGDSVGTDGTVIEGRSSLNEAAVTGESMPVEKAVGAKVFAGTLNGDGALVVEATATTADNTLARIVHLVEEAQEQKGRGEVFMTRFARVYAPAVLAVGAAVALLGGLSGDWSIWLERAATVVVAAAPCALVIAIPVTYVAAIGRAGRRGVLIKGGVHLEALALVQVLAMDKTGTLTRGSPTLLDLHTAPGVDEHRLLARAAAVESRSQHPLARAVVAAAAERGLAIPRVDDFDSLPGAGATGTVEDSTVLVGSPTLMAERGIDLGALAAVVPELQRAGATAVVVARRQRAEAVLAIADTLRPEAAGAVAELHRVGVRRVAMLTGDNALTAEVIAAQAGMDEVHAGLRPEDKAAKVGELERRYGHVAMVGDGVNDAPALAAASVGIAMGAAGSDVALETADVALMSDNLSKLSEGLRIGRRTRTLVRQNLILSLLVLAVLVPGALFGVLSLPIAVAAHELSELVVIANGLRAAKA